MRYYLDCEFNGMGGELLSLALIPETDEAKPLYLTNDMYDEPIKTWVRENVMTVMYTQAERHGKWSDEAYHSGVVGLQGFGSQIADYLYGDPAPVIIADWITDITYLCQALNSGALYWDEKGGVMQALPSLTFKAERVDVYPTTLPGAIQHNAYWDAMALRHKLQGGA